jgi:hypothetical protein
VKIYRDDGAGMTYLRADEGSPVIIVPDHGEIMFRWRPVPPELLRYDTAAGVVLGDQLTTMREKLISGVVDSKATGPIKADLRALIEDVVK